MSTLVLTITIPNIEEKYGYPIGSSKLPPIEEVTAAINETEDHILWLLEAKFIVTGEYV